MIHLKFRTGISEWIPCESPPPPFRAKGSVAHKTMASVLSKDTLNLKPPSGPNEHCLAHNRASSKEGSFVTKKA